MTAATRFGRPLPGRRHHRRGRGGEPDWARSRMVEDILEERLGSLGVPVIYGLPLGRAKHLAALPLGVPCTLDADAKTLTVDEPALR